MGKKLSKKKKQVFHAYCWASGLIQFGFSLPEGALEIGRGEPKKLRDSVTVLARLAHDNKTLLVPGVPEAGEDWKAAVDAVLQFGDRVTRHMSIA